MNERTSNKYTCIIGVVAVKRCSKGSIHGQTNLRNSMLYRVRQKTLTIFKLE